MIQKSINTIFIYYTQRKFTRWPTSGRKQTLGWLLLELVNPNRLIDKTTLFPPKINRLIYTY